MEPMKPMERIESLETIPAREKWWPDDFGDASSSGSQNDAHYAFFREKHRLLIKQQGSVRTYDSGEHEIAGVSQDQSQGNSLAFTSQKGIVHVDDLTRLS